MSHPLLHPPPTAPPPTPPLLLPHPHSITPPDSSETNLSRLRIPGVLQRFSVSYFAVALTELLTTSFLYNAKKVSACGCG